MSWRVARTLELLRAAVNEAAPKRSKISDGTKGDDKHAKRKSHHNPNSKGVVLALDLTHDPRNGADMHALADWLVMFPDKRLSEIISRGRIATAARGWTWRPYKGINPHDHHVHFTASLDPKLYDSSAPWELELGPPKPGPIPEWKPLLVNGSKGVDVEELQRFLGVEDDGWFGDETERAVIKFQKANGLVPDGKVGPATWAKMEK